MNKVSKYTCNCNVCSDHVITITHTSLERQHAVSCTCKCIIISVLCNLFPIHNYFLYKSLLFSVL